LIYLTHGVVPHWNSERISHALFVPEWLFTLHLQQRSTKYVPLIQSLSGEGDALTIDDATYGGLQAALLALRHGHAVSWFVNGIHVELGLPYFPFQLSWMLDETKYSDCRFEGRKWKLQSNVDRRALRQNLKQRYMNMRSEEEIAHLLEVVSRSLGVDSAAMETSLRTVNSAELVAAAAAGVDLQNHGWRHLNPLLFSDSECTAEAVLNEDYLSQFRKAATRAYAPPFGRQVSLTSRVSDFMLLADRALISGWPKRNVVNRHDLLLGEFATVTAQERPPALFVGAQ
jgi:Polysaccharide deacetylase